MEDRETVAFVLKRTPAYQDREVSIEGDKYRSLLKDEDGSHLSPSVAKKPPKVFELYDEVLKLEIWLKTSNSTRIRDLKTNESEKPSAK